MKKSPPKMRFFTDQCVPESVAKVLEAAKYDVVRLREKIATDAPDALVAAVAEANGAVLVTMDSDFKSIASRAGIGKTRFRKLSLIRFQKCRESSAAARMRNAISLIEHEWKCGNGASDRRMFVVISEGVISTNR